MVLEEFSEQLYDPLNYGLYLPPTGGKAGKFLDEERPLDDYKLQGKTIHYLTLLDAGVYFFLLFEIQIAFPFPQCCFVLSFAGRL